MRDADELDAAEYIVLVTTVPKERLDVDQILALYRVRWQVELDFKRDKSLGQLDTSPSMLPQTLRSWLCAKVLLGLIARRLASRQVAGPPPVDSASRSSPRRRPKYRAAPFAAEPWYVM